MDSPTLTYTRRDLTNAFMRDDAVIFGNIVKTTIHERNLSQRIFREHGIPKITAYYNTNANTNRNARRMPSHERLQTIADILFNEHVNVPNTINNDTYADYILNHTKYIYDYELCLDFDMTMSQIDQERRKKRPSPYLCNSYTLQEADAKWPDPEPIKAAIINGMNPNDLIEALRKSVPEFDDFCYTMHKPGYYHRRINDYITGQARMPQALYDAAMDYIKNPQTNKFADIKGYLDTRRKILTLIYDGKLQEADHEMCLLIKKRHSSIVALNNCMHDKIFTVKVRQICEQNHRQKTSITTQLAIWFDEICEKIYAQEKSDISTAHLMLRKIPWTMKTIKESVERENYDTINAAINTLMQDCPITRTYIERTTAVRERKGQTDASLPKIRTCISYLTRLKKGDPTTKACPEKAILYAQTYVKHVQNMLQEFLDSEPLDFSY